MQQNEKEKSIDSGIPFPGVAKRSCRKYPFADMKVGDSFMVESKLDRNRAATASFKFREYGIGMGWKFSTRKVDGGYRIWRTE
jgi:hypothetical protein